MKTQNIVFFTGTSDHLKNENDRRFWPIEPQSSRPTSAIASRISHEPPFAAFLHSIGYSAGTREEITAAICEICSIDTRAELDRNPVAASTFDTCIAARYNAFLRRTS